jgi:ubiquinone biosynthesis protein
VVGFVQMRTVTVAALLLWEVAVFLFHSANSFFLGRHADHAYQGKRLAGLFERLGGGYLKLGQILSTRADILACELILPLQRLQDSLAAFPSEEARLIVEQALKSPSECLFVDFDPLPIGSATIAQVHRAVLRSSGEAVAVKVRRPGIDRMIGSDCRTCMTLVRLISVLPGIRGIPVVEAMQQIIDSIKAQADFRIEAERHRQFFSLFRDDPQVRVPRLLDQYCTQDVLTMQYFDETVKIIAPELDEQVHRNAVTAGLHALYKMLFVGGLVHCDLHPGNVLVDRQGVVLILDFGFSTVMAPKERAAFAEFFLCIAVNDGATATRIVLETALRVPGDLNLTTFQRDIADLVESFSGRIAGEFLIADFVNRLFNVQRRHRIYGSPSFTMAILSLIVYEGTIRYRCASLDFQREALPILFASLHDSAQTVDAKR